MNLLRVLLGITVFWTVQALHLPGSFGVRGLNAVNTLVILTVIVLVSQRLPRLPVPSLRAPILFFFFALAWGWVVGQINDGAYMVDDLTVVKTGVLYVSLYFIFYYGVRDLPTARVLYAVMLGTALLAGLEAVREAFDYGFAVYSESKRAAGPFGEDYKASNLAAVYFAIMIPVFFALAFFLRGYLSVRLLAIGGVVLLVSALFFTYSRQAYAIVAIIGLLLALRKNLLLALLFSIALWNYELWVPNSAVERVQSTTEQVDAGPTTQVAVDASTESRWELWAGARQMFVEQPWGIGLNRFKRVVHEYTQFENLDAHNFYVLITAEAGVVGAIAILWLAIALLVVAGRQVRNATSPEAQAVAFGFLGATIALLMGNLYGSRFLNGEVVAHYWIFAGLAARYFQMVSERGTVPVAPAAVVPATAFGAARARAGIRPTARAGVGAGARANVRPGAVARDRFGRQIGS